MSGRNIEAEEAAQGMTRDQEVAIAIKRCLESLVQDARRSRMGDLAEFLALAALAADDAARAARVRPDPRFDDLRHRPVSGSC